MVVKKKVVKKNVKSEKKSEKDEGVGLDDALGGMDDGDVVSGESKPRKIKKKDEDLEDDIDEAEEEVEAIEKSLNGNDNFGEVKVKASKPISKVKKGDKIKVDGKEYEVDAHIVLMDHGKTKEMAIEIFDAKADKDYQLRYFSDQVETSIEFFELQEIIYVRKRVEKVEW